MGHTRSFGGASGAPMPEETSRGPRYCGCHALSILGGEPYDDGTSDGRRWRRCACGLEAMDQAEWFAVDWGTTHLRVWVFGPDERLLTCLTSDKGMSKIKPHDFEPVLLDLVASYLG